MSVSKARVQVDSVMQQHLGRRCPAQPYFGHAGKHMSATVERVRLDCAPCKFLELQDLEISVPARPNRPGLDIRRLDQRIGRLRLHGQRFGDQIVGDCRILARVSVDMPARAPDQFNYRKIFAAFR